MKKFLMFGLASMLAVLSGCAAPEKKVQKDAELFDETETNLKRFANVMPPEVKTIACISPGSTPSSLHHRKGVELLRQAGYNVKVMPHAFVRQKNIGQAPLAGRLADFYAAWNDPEVDMIFCVRGGRGSEEVLDNLDWTKLKDRPELYFQGYSDITLIVGALLAKKNGHPIAGPMAGSMSGLPADAIDAMRKMNHGEALGPIKIETLVPGECKGYPVAGLLQRFNVLADKDYCPATKDKIIFIEGVSIDAKTVKKCLYDLKAKKFFDGVKGVVFCKFARCNPAKEVDAIIREFAPKLGVPVLYGYPFGHVSRCYSIDFTRPVEIKNSSVYFPEVKK